MRRIANRIVQRLVSQNHEGAITNFRRARGMVTIDRRPVIIRTKITLVSHRHILPVPLLGHHRPFNSRVRNIFPNGQLPFATRTLRQLVRTVKIVLGVLRHRHF